MVSIQILPSLESSNKDESEREHDLVREVWVLEIWATNYIT